ncbi:ribonuclease HII [Moraxella catarrhalis]|uniref:ribonuclease HII n=1 Tax=Moraxella catarrhalis TaxID=480 RepID=UPI0007E4162E|nr:ribonuclease HII [Moraxella catarrhalis]
MHDCTIFTKPNVVLSSHTPIIGVDEVGRGALFGNMTVGAVVLPNELSGRFDEIDLTNTKISLLNDSKKLSEKRREQLFDIITDLALDYAIVDVPRAIIDQINIHQATMLGMKIAIETIIIKNNLNGKNTTILVDGNQLPSMNGGLGEHFHQIYAMIKGDATHSSIACASILAKVHRDRLMIQYAKSYPEYLLDKHKGYLTAKHKAAILEYGILPEHRRSFSPIRELYSQGFIHPNYWHSQS